MTGNVLLAARMQAAGLRQQELAQALNRRIEAFCGTPGKLQDRHVRNWLTGRTLWPQARQRRALEEEFGCPAEELGFCRPARLSAAHPVPLEDSVRRRTFAGAAAGLAAAAALPAAPRPHHIGMGDAARLETQFTALVADDNAHGGTIKLETRALAFAHHAAELQAVGSATQRVRARLYSLAASFTGTAVWAAVDARVPERAQQHLGRAMTLAGLAADPQVQLRLWGLATLLASQQQLPHDAFAAARAGSASPACRRDPLFRSFAAARLCLVQAASGDASAALRSLDQARTSFVHADPQDRRPSWIGFYDLAELEGISALAMAYLGRHQQSEAYLHRTLARLRPQYTRNRAYYRAQLALAQLRQGDAEHACTTAASVLPPAGGDSLTARTGRLLATFTGTLPTAAPGARCAAQWAQLYDSRKGRTS
ncbi:hypothetical protein [Streptomyces sp. NPDC055189]